jgi:hypothetical protein
MVRKDDPVNAAAEALLANDAVNNPWVPDFIERKILRLGLRGAVAGLGLGAAWIARSLATRAAHALLRRMTRKKN